jgi:predicted GNAT family acetyltransferase
MKVRDSPAERRFELSIAGSDEPAVAYCQVEGDRLTLTHTDVPQPFAGRGIGSELARGVFDGIRASGRKAVLRCRRWAEIKTGGPIVSVFAMLNLLNC